MLDAIIDACDQKTKPLHLVLLAEEWWKADMELEKDVLPNPIVALHHQWDLVVRLACHPGSAECSVIRHLQIVHRHRLTLQSAFDG